MNEWISPFFIALVSDVAYVFFILVSSLCFKYRHVICWSHSKSFSCCNSILFGKVLNPLTCKSRGDCTCSLQQALDHRNSGSCTSGHDAHRYLNCATGIRPIQASSSHLPPWLFFNQIWQVSGSSTTERGRYSQRGSPVFHYTTWPSFFFVFLGSHFTLSLL